MLKISRKKIKKILAVVFFCLVVVLGVLVYVWLENRRPPVLEVYVMSLKSGQSVFIRTPNDKRILIDGGTNSEIIRYISSILPFYARNIDKIIVTTADSNHVTGLIDVINRYFVGEVIVPSVSLEDFELASSSDQIYQTFIDIANKAKIPIRKVLAGDMISLDNVSATSSVKLDVLFPVASSSFIYSKASGPELVAKISYGSTSIMLAGDVTPKIQKFIASSSPDLKSEVLILSQNAITNNIAATFMTVAEPDQLVYSKSKGTTVKMAAKVSTKIKPDPLAGIPEDQRFNIREVGELRIVSDGKSIEIIKQ